MQEGGEYPDFNAAKAELFEAISHPVRIKILQTLSEKPMGFAELARAVGVGSGGHLSFHLTKLGHLVRMTPEGNYELTGDGKEALWSVNSLRQATDRLDAKARGASLKHASLTKPLLAVILIAVIVLGGFGAYQQGEFASQQQQLVSQQKEIGILQAGVPFTNGQSASLVIGQPDFTSYSPRLSGKGINNPGGVALDSAGDLWVSDQNNFRVLEFKPPFSTWMNASLVIGAGDLNHLPAYPYGRSHPIAAGNFGGGYTTCCGPAGIAFDSSGNLWVADFAGGRVMEFKSPFTDGMDASVVIGEPDFFTDNNGPGLTEPTAPTTGDRLDWPSAVAFDPSGKLWVMDNYDNRALAYTPPFTNGMNASLVLGQANFTGDQPGKGLNRLDSMFGDLTVDNSGDVWVGDPGNNRILEFQPPFSSGMNASLVIDKQNLVIPSQPNSLWQSANLGWSLAFDQEGNLWASDNSRFLVFKPPFEPGVRSFPFLEIGQPNFTSTAWNGGQSGLGGLPIHPAFDPKGDLWVPDQQNNRVLEFSAGSQSLSVGDPGPLGYLMGHLWYVLAGSGVLAGGAVLGVVWLRSRRRRHSTVMSGAAS